jgi:transposase
MERKRRKFTREFKVEAVRLVVEGGMSVARVARDLGIRSNLLGRWKRGFEGELGGVRSGEQEGEVERLRRENKRLQMERDFLKKAAAYFAKESE